MKKIVLIGAGGHCKVIIDIIKGIKEYEIIGITDKGGITDTVLDVPVIGTDDILPKLFKDGVEYAFICVGALSNLKHRENIYDKLKEIGFKIPMLVHKSAIVSDYAQVSEGTCVMAGAIINPGAFIGKNCIINTGAIIEHDCVVSDSSHISPGVALAGGVKVGTATHIGIGSSVIQNVEIGNNVTIGAGAVVINSILDNVLAVGVPAKEIK